MAKSCGSPPDTAQYPALLAAPVSPAPLAQPAKSSNLSPRHRLFASYVAAGMPGCDAYLKAGFKANRNTAKIAASRLKKTPGVAAEIERRLAIKTSKDTFSMSKAKKVLGEIAEGHDEESRDRIGACVAYAKLTGAVTERHEHAIKGQIAHFVAPLASLVSDLLVPNQSGVNLLDDQTPKRLDK